jgi:23S rRNA (guanine745-N1)-methyltransferase
MEIDCATFLTCPVCHEPLHISRRSLRCPQRHTFDLAREGHVDLLPTGHGRSGIQGDTAAMIRARRRFLDRGHFLPLTRALGRLARLHLRERTTPGTEAATPRPVLLEAGCGDGHYLAAVAREVGMPACSLGFDVSPAAARAAAKRHRDALFFVNDVRHGICVADAAVDVLLNVFAPRNAGEFARVVRPGGLLLVAIPGADHMASLREHVPLLRIDDDKREQILDAFAGALVPAGEESVALDLALDGVDVADVLRMTPSAWHAEEADVAAAENLPPVRTRASFTILRFQRPAGPGT